MTSTVSNAPATLYIGLMSGTSMDGVDAVLATLDDSAGAPALQVLQHVSASLPAALRAELMALNQPGDNELHRAALAANGLVRVYADATQALLRQADVPAHRVRAIGAHGQTVRHRPGAQAGGTDATGYTLQLNNPALLAELTGIDVVADFRSRDVAAGGQGAPLVPAFHQQLFARPDVDVAVLNLGGIANLTLLPARPGADVLGFDCGPANALMDHWIAQHRQHPFDVDGQWAAGGRVQPALLAALLGEPYFRQAPPKSTGRDLFHAAWLQTHLDALPPLDAQDVQATLLALTVQSITRDLQRHLPHCAQLLVCGGGALNGALMRELAAALAQNGMQTTVGSTASQGLPPLQVEAAAFAWLAHQALQGRPGNLPSVTDAAGPRVLGAIYPA
ncbi:MAG: Anhydro-N-acetylmuramic acid kinase [Paracidovorax wautersii]|uniref:Anhydro-N-acetylmuramic acid kinase n=1 Tax=Paracidovorax wautersii TaxID=1177982 RepID=A0A7V8JRD8_9BURK|nr:MAG: Anhydro-N-acetylmuramic acid kinase [Paracidovorax wautersii]